MIRHADGTLSRDDLSGSRPLFEAECTTCGESSEATDNKVGPEISRLRHVGRLRLPRHASRVTVISDIESYGEGYSMPRSTTLARAARVEPDESVRDALHEVARMPTTGAEIVVRRPDGTELRVPPQLIEVMLRTADELASGHAVTILASESVLTPAEVGELLGLSRPFIVRLLDEGEIPSSYLPGSRHRIVRLDDVLVFAERRRRRQEGRRRIADAVTDAELPY